MSPVDRTRGDATGDARERRDADPDGPTDNGKVRARARPSCALFAINIHYNHAPAQALQTDTRSDALAPYTCDRARDWTLVYSKRSSLRNHLIEIRSPVLSSISHTILEIRPTNSRHRRHEKNCRFWAPSNANSGIAQQTTSKRITSFRKQRRVLLHPGAHSL